MCDFNRNVCNKGKAEEIKRKTVSYILSTPLWVILQLSLLLLIPSLQRRIVVIIELTIKLTIIHIKLVTIFKKLHFLIHSLNKHKEKDESIFLIAEKNFSPQNLSS